MCQDFTREERADLIIEEENATKYKSIHTGICAGCSDCVSQWGMEIEKSDFKVSLWSERDRLHFALVDVYSGQHTLIEFWDDAAREFLEDWGISTDKLHDALWEHADDTDAELEESAQTEILQEKISREDYIDEGGFSHSDCDLCRSGYSGDRYAAHGWTEIDGKDVLIHYDICSDCADCLNGCDCDD